MMEMNFSVYQNKLYHLLENRFRRWRKAGRNVIWGLCGSTFQGSCIGAIAIVFPFYLLNWKLGSWTDCFLYPIPVAFILCAYLLRFGISYEMIDVWLPENEKKSRLHFGRLEPLSNEIQFWFPWGLFCALMSGQVFLLIYTHHHAGLDISGRFDSCVWITADNVLHGVLLDVCELYQISLTDPVDHSVFSASVFLFFRTTCDAMVILQLYHFYQRWRLRHVFKDFPCGTENQTDLIDWMQRMSCREQYLQLKYWREYVFIRIAAEYLQGNHERVEWFNKEFPQLKIHKDLRNLFRTASGDPLLEPAVVRDDKSEETTP